ncbi:MAG: hypothetical protein ACRD8Z_11125 [Nitrososphaeraceae archaeon]
MGEGTDLAGPWFDEFVRCGKGLVAISHTGNTAINAISYGTGPGASSSSRWGRGFIGLSDYNHGIEGISFANPYPNSPRFAGVYGSSTFSIGVLGKAYYRTGVSGESLRGTGVIGESTYGTGVIGQSNAVGVHGRSIIGPGVIVEGMYSVGVHGISIRASGVFGISNYIGVEGRGHTGVSGNGTSGPSVSGASNDGYGVADRSNNSVGVFGTSNKGNAIYGRSNIGYAAYLEGNVKITGNLEKAGGSFKIDHPLDPANKYLSHSFVESPDMKNIYDGMVVLDKNGEAYIDLPDWFCALNRNFRYQLTAIGAAGPNLHIAGEISDCATNNIDAYAANCKTKKNYHFKISGGSPGMKVSWNVTGIRKDPWANAHRIPVEEDKPIEEKGHYMYPDLYDNSQENRLIQALITEAKRRQPKS